MREEIASAVVFLTRLVRQTGSVSSEKVEEFSGCLSAILVEKFKNHWYQDHPTKGQGYRCIRINPFEPIDPVLEKAAVDSGLQYADLQLPFELTLWVDPHDVCCRFGESRGSLCTLAANSKDGNFENRAHTIDIEELLSQEIERHNQQVNIVTTRSNMGNQSSFTKGLHHGSSANYYSKHQHNFFNNQQFQNTHNRFRPQNKNQSKKAPQHEEQVNGVRLSPEHANEVRQQFMEQVNSVAKGKERAKKPAQPKPKLPTTNTESANTANATLTNNNATSANLNGAALTNNNNNSGSSSNTSRVNNASSATVGKNVANGSKSVAQTTVNNGPKQSQKGRNGQNVTNALNNTASKPGSYSGGKNSQWNNRANSQGKYSQKSY